MLKILIVYFKLLINTNRFNVYCTCKYLLFVTLLLVYMSKKYDYIFTPYNNKYAHHYFECVTWAGTVFSISSPVIGWTMLPMYPCWLFAVRHSTSWASVVCTSEEKWNVYLAVIRPLLRVEEKSRAADDLLISSVYLLTTTAHRGGSWCSGPTNEKQNQKLMTFMDFSSCLQDAVGLIHCAE